MARRRTLLDDGHPGQAGKTPIPKVPTGKVPTKPIERGQTPIPKVPPKKAKS
jgi:hypothetical protein